MFLFTSPLGLVPEVAILQAFETQLGKNDTAAVRLSPTRRNKYGLWVRPTVAGIIIVAISLTLLRLTISLHKKVREEDEG